MSKMDAQRAMREANWAARQKKSGDHPARPSGRPAAPSRAATPRVPATEAPAATADIAAADGTAADGTAADGACGHRSMNGRTCSRPAGHSEKSHRYA